jgi:predicted PurR-regulated permease PerM
MAFVGQLLNGLLGLFSNFVLIALTMTFLLLEAADFRLKLQAAWGNSFTSGNGFNEVAAKVQRYLALKTLISLATGVLISLWTHFLGLDFPLLWGLIAFLLNYVPSIGSIIAAVPAVLLAILQLGGIGALWVALGFVVTNLVLGNIVEPRLMGRTLGLSPLVVFLSLLFWGWLWGPAGMLLSVPLTVIAKILLESSEGGRPIAVLLGPVQEARQRISDS